MRRRIGTKEYDTEKAILVDTTEDGIEVYRKKNSPQFFLYNPKGKVAKEMFFELPAEQAVKYLDVSGDKTVRNTSKTIKFSDYNIARIRRHATEQNMTMAQFLLMLVDRYEQEQK